MIYKRVPDRNYFVGIDLMGEESQISWLNIAKSAPTAVPRTIRGAPVQLRKLAPVLAAEVPLDRIRVLCFTAQGMDAQMESLIRSAAAEAGLEGMTILCEEHLRSFYSYMLMQEDSQKKKDVILLEGYSEQVKFTRLGISRKTKPSLCWAKEIGMLALAPDEAGDRKLAEYTGARLEAEDASAVYLAGAFFEGEWLRRTAETIAKGRRAFAGDNLFSRGAVCSGLAAEGYVRGADRYFFLPPDSLRFNIYMRCRRKYAQIRLPLLEAGAAWRTTQSQQELIMEEDNVLELEVSSVTEGTTEEIEVHLDPFPERGGIPTRIRITFAMSGPQKILLAAEDLGFGEISPSSGMKWEQEISLQDNGLQDAPLRQSADRKGGGS